MNADRKRKKGKGKDSDEYSSLPFEKEDFYRIITERISDVIWTTDMKLNFLYVSASVEQVLGYTPTEFLTKKLDEIMTPDSVAIAMKEFKTAMECEATGEEYEDLDFEVELIRKDESTVCVELSRQFLRDNNNQANGILGVARNITKRKAVETALREREERYRTMIQSMQDMIFVYDKNDCYSQIHASNEKFLVAPAAELMGQSVTKMMPKAVAEKYLEMAAKIRKTGESYSHDYELNLDGEHYWFTSILSLHEDGESIVSVARNITDRKQIDDALRTSQAFLAKAQRLARLGSWDWDVINDIDVWSEETYRICGLENQEIKPSYEKFLEFIHPEDRRKVRKAVQETLNTGKPYSIDHRILRRDGTIRMVHEEGEATFDERGRPSRMFGTMLDVTERVQAEDLLRESELRYRTFVQNFQGIAYQMGPERYRPIFFHGTVDEITGYTAEDFVEGRVKWTDILDESDIDPFIDTTNKLHSIDDFLADTEYKIIRKGGETRWIRDIAQTVTFGKGKDPVIQGVFYDVTARKMAERATQEARSRAEFFNDLMAHDLNNIHQGLMASLELLLLDSDLPAELTQLAENALSQVERSIALIRSVRKFSSIHSEIQSTVQLDLHESYSGALQSIYHTFPERAIEVKTNITPRQFKVQANDLLFDVFFNIFHNAVKFDTHEKAVIDITAKYIDNDKFILIKIDDRGPGIAPFRKPAVLDRLERTATTSSGIGLTLVKQIIDKFGGTIWIEDRVPEDYTQGSSFVFKIPRA